MALTTKIRQREDLPIIDLSGKITLGESAGKLRQVADELLAEGKKRMLLNMAEVSYVDSAGLGALATCYAKVKGEDGFFALYGVAARVEELINLTRLNEKILLFPNEGAGFAAMMASAPGK